MLKNNHRTICRQQVVYFRFRENLSDRFSRIQVCGTDCLTTTPTWRAGEFPAARLSSLAPHLRTWSFRQAEASNARLFDENCQMNEEFLSYIHTWHNVSMAETFRTCQTQCLQDLKDRLLVRVFSLEIGGNIQEGGNFKWHHVVEVFSRSTYHCRRP